MSKTSFHLKKIQAKLNQRETLYLSGYPDATAFPKFSLKTFIQTFLTKLTRENNTLSGQHKLLVSTISRRRSVGDIYNICRFYFENVTLEEVMLCLAKLWIEKKVGYFYCNSTACRVWMEYKYYKTHTINPFEYAEPDEFGITPEMIEELSQLEY